MNIFCIHIDPNLSTGFTADILTHFKDTDITQARYVSLIGEAVADDLSTYEQMPTHFRVVFKALLGVPLLCNS